MHEIMKISNYSEYYQYPFIISPNLGMPTILIQKDLNEINEKSYNFSINIVANKKFNISQINEALKNNLVLVPLYEHDKKTKKLIRGYPISIHVNNIKNNASLMLENELLNEFYSLKEKKQTFLIRHNFFGENMRIFSGNASFRIDSEEKNLIFLEKYGHLMFDLYQTFPNTPNKSFRICYHAVDIRKNTWDEFRFVQITDLHIAKRYDEILGTIINNKRNSKVSTKKLSPFFKKFSLKSRYKNPNNKFRQFIIWANERSKFGKLDVIFITGDIIDYFLKNSAKHRGIYTLNDSNWEVFLNIVLNEPMDLSEGCSTQYIVSHEELSVPLYTQIGNHDIRVYPYSLKTAGFYRKFGLNIIEALSYKDPFKIAKYKALISDRFCLRPYYQYINPFDDYFLKFDKNIFLMMNSRGESLSRMKELLMGNPKCKGFSDRQNYFMKNVAKKYMKDNFDTNNFLISHAPLLNPIIKNFLKRKIISLFKTLHEKNLSLYREKNLKLNKNTDGNADKYLKFNQGIIMNNWKSSLELILKYNMVNLAGHTHNNLEIRFVHHPENTNHSFPFSIYFDDYTYDYSVLFLNKNRPYVLQTPSLGVGRPGSIKNYGGYREIEIKNDQIIKMSVQYLSKFITDEKSILEVDGHLKKGQILF